MTTKYDLHQIVSDKLTLDNIVLNHIVSNQKEIFRNIKRIAVAGHLEYNYFFTTKTHFSDNTINFYVSFLETPSCFSFCTFFVKLKNSNTVLVQFNFEKLLFLTEECANQYSKETSELAKIISNTPVYRKACNRAEFIFTDVVTNKIQTQTKSCAMYQFTICNFSDSLLFDIYTYTTITRKKLGLLFNSCDSTNHNVTETTILGGGNNLYTRVYKNLGVF